MKSVAKMKTPTVEQHLLGLFLKLVHLQQALQLLLRLVGQDHQFVDFFVHLVVQCI